MDMVFWLATFLTFGLLLIGAMVAFVFACEQV